jgi:hypothetical protein
MSGYSTPGTMGPGYNPKIWIRPIPSSSKWLRNHTPCTGYDPTLLLAEEGGPPTEKEQNPGAIHTNASPYHDRCGPVGSRHLSAHFTSLLGPGQAWPPSCITRG